MAAAKKSMNGRYRKRASEPKAPTTIYERMVEKPGNTIVAIVAILTAAGLFWGWMGTLALNGPMPYASRAEVDKLRKETIELGATTLELAKAGNVAAQQAVQTGNQNRLDGLLARKVQLDALIAMNPNDTGLKLILEQTVRAIGDLSTSQKAQAPALTGAPAVK